MHNTSDISTQFLRSDPLTGVGNVLAFFEWLLNHINDKPIAPFTLVTLDIKALAHLNQTHGITAGDVALRWAALVLLEEAQAQVYRISGDEFVGVLTEGSTSQHANLVRHVNARLSSEASQVNLEPPAAFIAMIHFTGLEQISPEDVLGVIYGALIDIKLDPNQSVKVFDAHTTKPASSKSGLINDLVGRMVSLGWMLDKSSQLAYTDSITGLPNMHAARRELERILEQNSVNDTPFALLLIDGDDLGKYNQVSYLVGDDMIKRLGSTLKSELRPDDFIARWRSGDEFVVLIQDTTIEMTLTLAKRLRKAVSLVSQDWMFPITISLGAVLFPQHGRSVSGLLHQAEVALKVAKDHGKDQVVLAR